MYTHYTYLLIDTLCILFPLLFSFHPAITFYKHLRAFTLSCLPVAVLFGVWDAYFTYRGIWSFNPRYVTGFYVFNLPVEELLFFICIPYACVFTYYCFKLFYDVSAYARRAARFSILLIAILLIIAILNHNRLYTSVTFVLLSVLLLVLHIKRVSYMANFYLSFIVILFPFFISNGLLTGSFLQEPVVSYNNSYNLGIRMYTIPVEDVFYGMLLLLLNVAGFEYFSDREKQ